MTQRWRDRRDSYRRPDEQIRTSAYDVAPIGDDMTARRFVEQHHYSGTYPAARERLGLYRGGGLVGVAVFSHPASDAVLTNVFPGVARDSVELGRFVLLDDVEGNGETWFLARCFEMLRAKAYRGVVSFSDPMPRYDLTRDRQVFAGHVGTIYQAHNAVYLGRATSRTLRLLPDGTVFSARAASKIRAGERGWRYAADTLERFGAAPLTDPNAGPSWLAHWLPILTRAVRHPGNHRYAWRLNRRVVIHGLSRRYPKKGTPA
jgi:hypothetical protein